MKKKSNHRKDQTGSKFVGNIDIGQSEIEALLLALPYVIDIETEDPAMRQINADAVQSAGVKLVNMLEGERQVQFTAKETLVMSGAVTMTVAMLKGEQWDVMPIIEPEDREEMNKYLFTYNKLEAQFDKLVDKILPPEDE